MFSISQADVIWVKLARHVAECVACGMRKATMANFHCPEADAMDTALREARIHESDAMIRTVFKTFKFEAAHRLPNLPPEHQCSRLHGHSWYAEVHVRGNMDEKIGWLVDFAEIKRVFKPLHDKLDHSYLNEIEGLENPTSEKVAEWLWARLADPLRDISAILVKIIVQETCTSGAIIERDPND